MYGDLYVTAGAKTYPETLLGTLQFNLSTASFESLKARGEFHHHYIDIDADDTRYSDSDVEGTLISDGPSTFKLIVNDKAVEVPTIEANYVNHKTNDIIRVKVLDEARFPFLIDYYSPSLHSFFITYTKVSFPTANEVEQHLAADKHTDVYGIYFNFASDELLQSPSAWNGYAVTELTPESVDDGSRTCVVQEGIIEYDTSGSANTFGYR
jgi:hypothetical protein